MRGSGVACNDFATLCVAGSTVTAPPPSARPARCRLKLYPAISRRSGFAVSVPPGLSPWDRGVAYNGLAASVHKPAAVCTHAHGVLHTHVVYGGCPSHKITVSSVTLELLLSYTHAVLLFSSFPSMSRVSLASILVPVRDLYLFSLPSPLYPPLRCCHCQPSELPCFVFALLLRSFPNPSKSLFTKAESPNRGRPRVLLGHASSPF